MKRKEVINTTPDWQLFLTEVTDFITANAEVIAVMVAGAVVGLIAFGVKRLSKAGR